MHSNVFIQATLPISERPPLQHMIHSERCLVVEGRKPKLEMPTPKARSKNEFIFMLRQSINIDANVAGNTAINIHKWKSSCTKKVALISGTSTIKIGTIRQCIAHNTAILIVSLSIMPMNLLTVLINYN